SGPVVPMCPRFDHWLLRMVANGSPLRLPHGTARIRGTPGVRGLIILASRDVRAFRRHPVPKAPHMQFRFPIVIIDEDWRADSASGLGIRALAKAIEEQRWEVVGGFTYTD